MNREPCGPQSKGSHKVGHDWNFLAHIHIGFTCVLGNYNANKNKLKCICMHVRAGETRWTFYVHIRKK